MAVASLTRTMVNVSRPSSDTIAGARGCQDRQGGEQAMETGAARWRRPVDIEQDRRDRSCKADKGEKLRRGGARGTAADHVNRH